MSTSPRPEADGDADEGQNAARCDNTGAECSARTMSKSKSNSGSSEQESIGTDLRSVGDYQYEQTPHGSHAWEHSETGLTVEMSRRAGQQDGYGRIEKGYTALARDADGEAVDGIIGAGEGFLPSKADAWRTVREWMQERVDGQLRGDEEVRF